MLRCVTTTSALLKFIKTFYVIHLFVSFTDTFGDYSKKALDGELTINVETFFLYLVNLVLKYLMLVFCKGHPVNVEKSMPTE